MKSVKRTERGWPGHYCVADKCRFRRNTLLELDEVRIVVSTVGCRFGVRNGRHQIVEIGLERYYETMVFHAYLIQGIYWDSDPLRQVEVEGEWCIKDVESDADMRANEMHEAFVKRVTQQMKKGEFDETAKSDCD